MENKKEIFINFHEFENSDFKLANDECYDADEDIVDDVILFQKPYVISGLSLCDNCRNYSKVHTIGILSDDIFYNITDLVEAPIKTQKYLYDIGYLKYDEDREQLYINECEHCKFEISDRDTNHVGDVFAPLYESDVVPQSYSFYALFDENEYDYLKFVGGISSITNSYIFSECEKYINS